MTTKMSKMIEQLEEFTTPSLDVPLETRVNSIPSDKIIEPNMSIATYLQEAFNIFTFAKPDKEILCSKGLNEQLFEELPRRIDFLREMEAQVYSACYSEVTSAKEFKRVYTIIDNPRKELLAAMDYALFGEDHAKLVDFVKKGKGMEDYSQDLWNIVALADEHSQKLLDTGCNMQNVEVLREHRILFGDLLACCNVEEMEKKLLPTQRNKAYTFLVVAMAALRRAAHNTFWNDKKHLRGYASEHFRKSTRKRKDGPRDLTE